MSKWTIGTSILLLALFTMIFISSKRVKEVTISEKHFSCTATEPSGIESRCTQYTWNKGVR